MAVIPAMSEDKSSLPDDLHLPGAVEVDPFEIEPMPERFLARNGRFFGKIYLSAIDTASGDIEAGFDLRRWLSRVAGINTEIPVVVENENVRSLAEIPTGIYIGNTQAAEKLGIFAPAGEGETFIIETRGNAIFIVGKTPTATRIAAGEFLRKELGIEFVWPGEEGAEWTPMTEIPFPREQIEHVPAFPWRLVGTPDRDWNLHLGFGDCPHFSHNLGRIFTKDVFAEKPELAPIVLGVRRDNVDGGYAPQPNLAASESVPVAFAATQDYFEENPDSPMFALGINDAGNWDESPQSENAYGILSYFRNQPNRSNYYYAFVNRVAEKLEDDARFADKKIGVIAYMDVQDAPTFPMQKNVVPVLCADRSMWVFPKFREEDKALMTRWAKSGVDAWGVYDYYYGTPFLFPRLFFKEQAEAIKFIHQNGGKIFYAECGPVVPFDAPKVWLASQLLRTPDADSEKILGDYYQKTFGDAAPAMKKFYDYCCEVWAKQGGQCRWIKGWNNENSVEIFAEEHLVAARSFLREAFVAVRKKNAVMLPEEEARARRIEARLKAVDVALTRAEKFTKSYFERKALANAKMETVEETLQALKSPAWRYEEIYDDAEFSDHPGSARISAYSCADPRPAALERVLNFISTTDSPDEKAQVNHALERIFEKAMAAKSDTHFSENEPLSDADRRLRFIASVVPAFRAEPILREDFEVDNFKNYMGGDWRVGKRLSYPQGWSCVIRPSEKIEMAPTTENPHGGKSAYRVAGESERVDLMKFFRVKPGQRVVARIFARGNVSCGSASYLGVLFFDAQGKRIVTKIDSLPVGENPDWRVLCVAEEVPANAVSAAVSVYVGLQGPNDFTCFDDLTTSVYSQ